MFLVNNVLISNYLLAKVVEFLAKEQVKDGTTIQDVLSSFTQDQADQAFSFASKLYANGYNTFESVYLSGWAIDVSLYQDDGLIVKRARN